MTEHPGSANLLSAAGEVRRAAMRDLLLREVDRRRVRRRLARVGAGAVLGFALVAAVYVVSASVSGPAATPIPPAPRIATGAEGTEPAAPAVLKHVRFEIVAAPGLADDPRIVRDVPTSARAIGDDELLLLLEAAGHPAGLIRTPGSARVTASIPPLPARDGPG